MAKRIAKFGFYVALLLIIYVSVAHAQQESSVGEDIGALVKPLIGSIVFSIVGLIILVIGYKVFDLVTPFDLNKEISEDNNTAAGVALAGILIALGLIIASAIT